MPTSEASVAAFIARWADVGAAERANGRRFGFLTMNSICPTLNGREVHRALRQGVSLRFAIPDHRWVDTADSAAVRIAMTVGSLSQRLPSSGIVAEEPPPAPAALAGDRSILSREDSVDDGSGQIELRHFRGRIGPGISIGAELEGLKALTATASMCGLGVALHGSGLILEPGDAKDIRKHAAKVIKPYLGGSDLLQVVRERYLIDVSCMTEVEARSANPHACERVLTHVKPERLVNRREAI